MCCPEKLPQAKPRLLYGCHSVPFTNCKCKLARTVNDHIGNVYRLVLRLRGSGGVGKLEEFFGDGKDGRDWFLRMVIRLLEDVLAIGEFLWYQLPVVFVYFREDINQGVIDGIRCLIAGIRGICILNCGKSLLGECCLEYRHFTKDIHFLGVRDSSV